MKLNILIVDDEPKVLKGLRTIIERSGEEWQVVGEYKNGVEALAAIKAGLPDVVITDIKMPCMGGLELVEEVKDIAPDLKFIILSGFPDFSFAQQAIRLETIDYILKPPDYRDILKSLKKAEIQLQEQELKKKNQEELESYKTEALLQQRNELFLEMLYSRKLPQLLPGKAHPPEMDIFCTSFALFVIKLENFSFFIFDETDTKLEILANFRKEVQKAFYERSGYVSDLYDGTFCCFLNVANDSPVYLKGLARELHARFSGSCRDGLTIGISNVYGSPDKIGKAYKECLSILRNKVFFDKNSIVQINDLKAENPPGDYPLELERRYIESLQFADLDKSTGILAAILRSITAISNKDPITFKNLIMEFIIVVGRSLSEDRTREYPGTLSAKNVSGNLSLLDNISDIEALLMDYTKSVVGYFSERNKPGCRKIINIIKSYINRNYFKDISLRQLSSEFFMNESYLSELFKKETGLSFSGYLTGVRMEQAKVLLRQADLKSSSVSEMVGYGNSRYFNKIFKKHTGLTPFEYRERMLDNELGENS